jgi:hypothetical protein
MEKIGNPKVVPLFTHQSIEGHTIYGKRVVWAGLIKNILKSGHNNKKIGKYVVKGKWMDMPIFTLTLEERATCPRCAHWYDCYGNKMNWAERIINDHTFEVLLEKQLGTLNKDYPFGFVVRLHVLGDFYSTQYVELWRSFLDKFKALRVYGYTSHKPDSEIGEVLYEMAKANWEKFAIRFSESGLPEMATSTSYKSGDNTDGIMCPAQTGKTECCGTCALCWGTKRNIIFLSH